MARLKEVFICQSCGASSPKWQGQCPACNEWNTLVAELQAAPSSASGRRVLRSARHDGPVVAGRGGGPRALTPVDRFGGARPRARWRPRCGLRDPDWRRSRNRQIDPDAAVGRGAQRGRAGAVRDRRGIAETGGFEGAASGARGGGGAADRRDPGRVHRCGRREPRGARADRRFHSDHVFGPHRGGSGGRVAAARGDRRIGAIRQGERHRRAARRTRHQGGPDRGAARARAHGRHGALFRERYGQPLPRAEIGQESIRRGQRDRGFRHGGAGPARGRQPFRDIPFAARRACARAARSPYCARAPARC